MLSPVLACESPIEESFLDAVVARAVARQITAVALVGDCAYPVTEVFPGDRLLMIRCQAQWRSYRFDFALELVDRSLAGSGPLVVECDGHAYHERTKEQAKRDRARDRTIQESGASIFRFTGSEIYADAQSCADQCIAFVDAKLKALLDKIRKGSA